MTWALLAFVGGAVGTAVMLVLVFKSLAEWHEANRKGEEPPGTGCEV